MALKVYKSVTGESYSFPVTVSEVKHRITVNPTYSTSTSGIQSAIEATAYYTSGKIITAGNYTTAEKARVTDDVAGGQILTHEIGAADHFKWTQFASVVNFTQAKEVLRAEPYNVHHLKLKTPEAVMAQAKAHSVEFPNWII